MTTPESLQVHPRRALTWSPGGLFIDGDWHLANKGSTLDCVDPSTGEAFAQIAAGDDTDVDRAVAAARRALSGPWKHFTPAERQLLLLRFADAVERHAEELNELDARDMGAPISMLAGRGTARTIETLRYFAGWATKIHGETLPVSAPGSFLTYTRKEPVGVVAAIIPWNGPMTQAIWKIAPVLATGCTMVLKPAEEASLTPLRLVELLRDVGLPNGVVNVVTGLGETAGAALANHPGVDKIAFTGSTVTGQSVARAAVGNLKRVTLELGGKSPDIVFADADLERAIPGVAMGVFANSGQVCCAGTRIFVQRSIYEEMVSGVASFAQSLRVGDSLDPATQIGPVVSEEQLGRVQSFLDSATSEGARLCAGGGQTERSSGFFVEPTVYADVDDEMRIAREEIFGPVASILPFDTFAEVVERANRTSYGLGGGVWTRDVGLAHQTAHALHAGVVWINCYGLQDPAVPFGGYKMSGWGKELGANGLNEYLAVKSVWTNIDGTDQL